VYRTSLIVLGLQAKHTVRAFQFHKPSGNESQALVAQDPCRVLHSYFFSQRRHAALALFYLGQPWERCARPERAAGVDGRFGFQFGFFAHKGLELSPPLSSVLWSYDDLKTERMQTQKTTTARPWFPLIGYVRSIFSFYFVSGSVEIESRFPVSETIERLLALNHKVHAEPRLSLTPTFWERLDCLFGWQRERPEVHVHVARPNRLARNPFRRRAPSSDRQAGLRRPITVGCARQSARSNILHLFRGGLAERDGGCILRGEIGLDRGISCVLGIFCALLWVFIPLGALVQGTFSGGAVVGMLAIWGLLELCHSFGRNDDEIILRNLREALTTEPAAAKPPKS
jgi:hypothetical protein